MTMTPSVSDREQAVEKVSAALRNDPLRCHTGLTDEQLELDSRVFARQIVDALLGQPDQEVERLQRAVEHEKAISQELNAELNWQIERADQAEERLRVIEDAAQEVVGAYTVFNDRPMNRLKAILVQRSAE